MKLDTDKEVMMVTKKPKQKTKAELKDEVKRLISLAHKALGAMEPNHMISCSGLGREYILEMINEGMADHDLA